MKLVTHYLFITGLLSLITSAFTPYYLVLSGVVAIAGNSIIDGLGHKEVPTKRGVIPTRTPLTHALPRIYGANYFLKDMEGRYLNSKEDKRVWLRWITERLEGRADHLRTAVGLIPTYEDLRRLFKEVLNKEYKKQQYELQFSIRLKEYKNKYLRIRELYSRVKDTPREVLEILDEQIGRIDKDIQRYGDTFSPFNI
jgi:hypothetical protein